MKRITFLFSIVFIFLFVGCKKEYTCYCGIYKNGNKVDEETYTIRERRQPPAKERCNNKEGTANPNYKKYCGIENN